MTASDHFVDKMRHSYSLRAIPLEELTEERLNDLSWLLGDDSIRNSYISLMVLDPVMLMFVDSLSEPRVTSEEHTSDRKSVV